MCGIAGIISNKSRVEKAKAIRQMTQAMSHRGPDASGHCTTDAAALGHRRLSIIDLSEEANQPMHDTSGRYIIVFNGEIYNFKKIKSECFGYPFKTHCDTEVILAAYAKWGAGCLEKMEGMFAFAIWDRAEKQLFVARDRLGIKPLYYYPGSDIFLFASEIRGLLASGLVPKKLNHPAVYEYLNYQTVHAPNTIVKNIFQLAPGEYGILKKGKLIKKKYWSLVPDETNRKEISDNYEMVKKEVRRLFFQAVEKRLISDVPLGAFLSGGIDSSAVVGAMSEISARPVETFSIVFDDKESDESPWSGLIARKNKTNHHPILLKPADFLEALPAAFAAMDTPTGDGVNTYMVSKMTRQAGMTVALSGLGGDELFAGYPTFTSYYKMAKNPFFWKIPKALRAGAASVSGILLKSHQRVRALEIAGAKNADIENIFPSFRKILTPKEIGYEAGALNGYGNRVYHLLKNLPGINNLPVLSRVTVADISTYTQNVLLKDTDQMSMAHSLEVRVPFFDYQLVEYLVQVPDRFKYPDYSKKLLVESLSPIIPPEVVHRPKLGFNMPWKIWMKNELRPFCESRLNGFKERGLTDAGKVDRIWNTFLKGKNDFLWSRVWILVVLEDWLQRQF